MRIIIIIKVIYLKEHNIKLKILNNISNENKNVYNKSHHVQNQSPIVYLNLYHLLLSLDYGQFVLLTYSSELSQLLDNFHLDYH